MKYQRSTGNLSCKKLTVPARFLSVLLFCSLLLCLAQNARAQSYAMSNLWTVAAGEASHPFLSTNDNLTRGLSYNPATDHVLVVSRTGSNAVHILDANNGAMLGVLPYDSTVITQGTFVINMIGVTTDGVIYACNLTTDANGATSPFRLYRWANETAQPQLVYSGDPSGNAQTGSNPRRFGDSMAVRGTGANTQILLGTYNQAVGLLRTSDGINFTATRIPTDIGVSDSRWGLAWGAGNTFWVKQGTGNLKQVALNLNENTGAVVANIPLPAGPGGPLDVDLDRNLLAIIQTSGTSVAGSHNLRLFDISNPATPVQIDATKAFPVAYTNGNHVGAVSMRNGKLFALETNNGILGYRLQDGVFYPVSIATQPASVTLWEGAQNWKFSVGLAGTPPYTYQWRLNGEDLPGKTSSTLSIASANLLDQGSYQVVVGNAANSVTSSPAVLTVQVGNRTAQVTNAWSIAPDTRPYLTSGSGSAYFEYGVAINPLTTNVIVVTRKNPTNMIAVVDINTGAHKHYIDYSSLPLSGSTTMNKVTVADDGIVFICNITTDAAASPFVIYGLSDDSPSPAITGALFSGDPGNGLISPTVGWGANLDARGEGPSTEILVGSGKWAATAFDTKAVAILKYNAYGTFSSTLIQVTNAPFGNNNFRFGLCWGQGNTFWVKALGSLMLVEYDLEAGTGFIKHTYPTTGNRSVPASVTAMAFDSGTQLLVGLQNGTPPTPVSVPVYNVSDVAKGPFWVDQELFTSYNADIEFQGSISFEKGYVVALGVNNGLMAAKVNPAFVSSLPVIVAHPVGGAWYEGTSPTLSVVADSMTPVTYQWYLNNQTLVGQTAPTLTIPNFDASKAGDYFVRVSNAGGHRDSTVATLTALPVYNTAQMMNIWSVMPGTRDYLHSSGYFDYGMSFNPVNSNLVVASYVSTNNPAVIIGVMDALTGAHKHRLNTDMVTGGNRWINKIGVADDGVVYAANRTTAAATDPLQIYRWADDKADTYPSYAFYGDPFPTLHANKLAGWTMDVRGAGIDTEILLSTSSSNVLSVLKTTDGLTFTPNEILVSGAPTNFARLGICFGEGNTFWVKTWLGSLYLVEYDLATATGTILKTWDTTQFPETITTITYNKSLKMLAGAARDDQKNIQLYSVANLNAAPVLLDQELYPTYNASVEANGALDFGGNTYLFGMNENNGVIAMLINPDYVPPVSQFSILSVVPQGGNVVLTWQSQSGKSYQVQSVESIGDTWQNLGTAVVATGDTATYSTAISGAKRFYRVVAQ
jgi:hypothetical protein